MRLEDITIHDYWKDYVNKDVDLVLNPQQPCPFHGEQHGKSFSYSLERKIFSCFGACHVIGGDVIALHQLNNKIKSREEAKRSIARLYNVDLKSIELKEITKPVPEEDTVRMRVAYANAIRVADSPEKWIELDIIMSKSPQSVEELEEFWRRYEDGRH